MGPSQACVTRSPPKSRWAPSLKKHHPAPQGIHPQAQSAGSTPLLPAVLRYNRHFLTCNRGTDVYLVGLTQGA